MRRRAIEMVAIPASKPKNAGHSRVNRYDIRAMKRKTKPEYKTRDKFERGILTMNEIIIAKR